MEIKLLVAPGSIMTINSVELIVPNIFIVFGLVILTIEFKEIPNGSISAPPLNAQQTNPF